MSMSDRVMYHCMHGAPLTQMQCLHYAECIYHNVGEIICLECAYIHAFNATMPYILYNKEPYWRPQIDYNDSFVNWRAAL